MGKRAYFIGLLVLLHHLLAFLFVDGTCGNEWSEPYPLCAAPLELRFAARVTGRVRQPEFTPEEIEENEELAERGLSQLSLATLYKAFKAKLASREAARQHLLTTTWELEEAEHYTSLLEAFHA